jgi:hypothetical protein
MRVLSTGTERLMTRLTPHEFEDRAEGLARAVQDVATEEARHADVKAQLKADLTKLEAERDRLTSVVSRRAELREVPVRLLADLEMGEALLVRDDSGEVVRRRPLTEAERQEPLPLE